MASTGREPVAGIRPRGDEDLGPLEAVLGRVHRTTGYPRYWPEGPGLFVKAPLEEAAWVADLRGRPVGHVAVHRATGDPLAEHIAERAGLAPGATRVVARLFVEPSVHRHGIGRRLLETAVGHVHGEEATPILDVIDDLELATRFYDALGWVRVGTFPLDLPQGRLELIGFRGPPPSTPSRTPPPVEAAGTGLSGPERRRLASTFEQASDLYDRIRPDYPSALFDRLDELTSLGPGARILEVGVGTGKATLPLARRGYHVTGLEPGPGLRAVAREKLKGYPVELIGQRFEDWTTTDCFDLVVAATAWHWVDPAVRYEKTADLLLPGGFLAFWTASHAFPPDADPFFSEIQEVYDALGIGHADPATRPGALGDQRTDVEASGRFEVVAVDDFVWEVTYGAEQYIDLLNTFSNHIAMEPAAREHLYTEIRRRLAGRPDGRVRRHWGSYLHVARRLP